ncbi:MAG: hypothetical protein NTZ51_05830 [Proteobacteria bacterium]|nr:hypothetical protein [Pseudomonadota bacterium]
MDKKKLLLIGFISLLLLALPAQAPAKTYEECNFFTKGCLNGAATILSLPYFPVKLGYALMGTLTAGTLNACTLKYAEPVTEKIAIRAAGGDWYITPQILLGEKKLSFSGSPD